ncbi:MAG: preprotein translocase subunit SecA [Oscillospiraceae bacterium]|nr:MAG: preprotein translocase subunit SecA [Oscillospiraceae bacterium]
MSIVSKIFGTYSDHQLRKLEKIADRIEALAPTYKDMGDEELRGMTQVFRNRLAAGETLDDILPDAFAAVREADDRVLGKRPFHVQLLGGIILHQGRIAEMKTGEGKTLVATMPAYLNALTGNGVHIVTVNDYLAARDAEEMGKVYGFMGLTTGLVVHGQTQAEKHAAYNADITYGTNNEYGFDYLRDNMVVYKERVVQRGHAFAIVDEVDSILIDEARTPLIISGEGEKPTDLYERADQFVRTLRKYVVTELDAKEEHDDIDADYIVDEKANTAVLTPHGVVKAEKFFSLPAGTYTNAENATLAHHINQAIKAHGCMKLDVDYVVNENGVMIVDAFTGRLMPGRRFSDGLHQAIEAKEGVSIQKENKTLATITFQNYFRMYGKLSGMTGTALTEEEEFREIYQLDVVVVPTNMPMIRKDHDDAVYKTTAGKYRAVVNQVRACHEKGQPVLVGTVSIDKSEVLSALLKKEGIRHTVLNAKYHAREAEIVAQAGKFGAVTISTNMAGRGTDIMLGGNPEYMAKADLRAAGVDEGLIAMATGSADTEDEAVLGVRRQYQELYAKRREEIAPEADAVRAAGGLFILGTERHESRRIDNQLRGRSGRQGDPGESKFFISLEDDLMRLFGNNERIIAMIDRLGVDEDTPIQARILSNTIESAQKRIEDQNFKRRKYVLAYDDVMNQQRNLIYKQRQQVLDDEDLTETLRHMIHETIEATVLAHTADDHAENWELDGLRASLLGYVCRDEDLRYSPEQLKSLKREDLLSSLLAQADQRLAAQEQLFTPDTFREVERVILLQNVDRAWMDHLDAMDELKNDIGLQAYANRDPVNEYRLVGADMFDAMVAEIRDKTVRMLLTVAPKPREEIKRVQVAKPLIEGFEGGSKPSAKKVVLAPRRAAPKVGRNDPCPCGSGKKYKNCCGSNVNRTV